MKRRVGLLGTAAFGMIAAAWAQEPQQMPASSQRVGTAVQTIAGDIASADALKDTAVHGGHAIKASCIQERIRHLQETLKTARELQDSFVGANQNAAYGARVMERISLLEVSANADMDGARQCTDAKNLEFELEVIVPPNLPDAPPTWPVRTPPVFERPPLVSPY